MITSHPSAASTRAVARLTSSKKTRWTHPRSSPTRRGRALAVLASRGAPVAEEDGTQACRLNDEEEDGGIFFGSSRAQHSFSFSRHACVPFFPRGALSLRWSQHENKSPSSP